MEHQHNSPASALVTGMQPGWVSGWLRAAALYNLAWGAWCILFPKAFWSLVGMEQPNYPFLWQCIGMIVGVYGVGYWIAASDVARHWPIVLVGLLGKIFGPIGFLWACFVERSVPPHFGLTILTNDILWWGAFALALRYAWQVNTAARRWIEDVAIDLVDPAVLDRYRDQHARSLGELSGGGGVLVVFLRHAGCTFCREALADLARDRRQIESGGLKIALVTQSGDESAAAQAGKYGLGDVARFSDPSLDLYRAVGLRRGRIHELLGPRVWIRGFLAGVMDGHGVGSLEGDGFQMPGAFVIRDKRVVRAYRHRDAADRPDYCELGGVSPT
jgi:peroxiredoxin